MKRRALLALPVFACLLGGCTTGLISDPNDPNDVGIQQPEVLRNALKGANEMLQRRVEKGEITEAQYRDWMVQAANAILDEVKVEAVDVSRAWEYAEVYITARRWKMAERFLVVALKNPPTEDRRVNDSLRLARVLAEQGRVAQAIPVAESVFNAPPKEKAPILPAVLLEIVPAGRGKGQDVGLAKLLEDAVEQSKETLVDPQSQAGAAFLAARGHHINNAWSTILSLYRDAGRRDLAASAAQRAETELAARARL